MDAEERLVRMGRAVRSAWRLVTSVPLLLLVAGCAGRFDYVRPVGSGTATTSVTVEKSADDIWRSIPQTYDASGLVVHGFHRASGVLILDYSGDPVRYVDCGYITSSVKNLHGERTYAFPAATGSAEYEFMTGREILSVAREMNVEARFTVTVVGTGTRQARLSVDGRYELTRTMTVRDTQGRSRTSSHTVRFASGQEARFPGTVTCRPNGELEAQVLSMLTR